MYNPYNKEWNKFRKMMWDSGAEIWCYPNISDDGRIEFTDTETGINNIMIDGVYTNPTPENIKLVAQILNDKYDEYDHDCWTDYDIIFEAKYYTFESDGCWRCPWFTECQQMDDEIGDDLISDEEEAELDEEYGMYDCA